MILWPDNFYKYIAMMKKLLHVVVCLMMVVGVASVARAQSSNPVVPTGKTQMINGVKYYIQVVGDNQTIFSISRAYGLHYSAAVIKTDIHELAVGDTVWLPYNEQSVAAVTKAIGKTETLPEYLEIEVEPKQTAYGISKLYGITLERFYELNPEVRDNGLKAGQKVKLPLGSKPKATGTTTTTTTTTKSTTTTTTTTNSSQTKSSATTQGGSSSAQPKPASQNGVKTTTTTTSTTQSSAAAKPATAPLPDIRERVSKEKVVVSVMMPLYLNRMGEISTTKFDVDQRGKKDYKSFEFIQFYEGLLMGLDDLERSGVKVQLNVVDVTSEKEEDLAKAYDSHDVANSDVLIALLQKSAFDIVANMAKRDHLFIVSPMTQRSEILKDNPYAVKYMPSEEGMAATLVEAVRKEYPRSSIFIVYANGREKSTLKSALEAELSSRSMPYTLCDWNTSAEKLATKLKGSKNPVVIATYDLDKDRNRLFANQILNKMGAAKSSEPVLYTFNNYVRDIPNVDYGQLQSVNYHLFYNAYLDYGVVAHKEFVDAYKNRFKTEPLNGYAAVAHDIILYFASGIHSKGADFWRNPTQNNVSRMLFPAQMKRTADGGLENQSAVIYKMVDLQLKQVGGR